MSSGLRNLGQFKAAIRAVVRETKKAEADVLNKALKDVGFRAMQFTAFASPAKIKAGLTKDRIGLKLAVMALRKKGYTTRQGKVRGTMTRAMIRKEAKRIQGIRRGRSKAIRAGWIPGIVKLGGEITGGAKLKQGSSASAGGAEMATIDKLEGWISNTLMTKNAQGATTPVEAIREAEAGLQKAIDFVASDREGYARKKKLENAIQAAINRNV